MRVTIYNLHRLPRVRANSNVVVQRMAAIVSCELPVPVIVSSIKPIVGERSLRGYMRGKQCTSEISHEE